MIAILKSIKKSTGSLVFALVSILINSAVAADLAPIYVQSVTAKINAEKKIGSENLAIVKRGQALVVLEVAGDWYKVKYNKNEGWISKLFVSKQKPVGIADISQNEKISPEKLSRKRSNNYSTSAAARGISVSERGRGNTEKYRSNPQAVEQIESEIIDPGELKKFEAEGNLNKDQ